MCIISTTNDWLIHWFFFFLSLRLVDPSCTTPALSILPVNASILKPTGEMAQAITDMDERPSRRDEGMPSLFPEEWFTGGTGLESQGE